jgi:hypothetical protein
MGRDWGAGVAARIWAGAIPGGSKEALVATPEEIRGLYETIGSAIIIEGWDFGVQVALTAWAVAAYFEATDTLWFLHYCSWENGSTEEINRVIGASGIQCRANPGGMRPHYRIGDKAGKQGTRKSFGGRPMNHVKGWIYNLEDDADILVHGQTLHPEWTIDRFGRRLAAGNVRLMPSLMRRHPTQPERPSLIECITSYSRAIPEGMNPADYVGEQPPPKKDRYSHGADAIQFIESVLTPQPRGK